MIAKVISWILHLCIPKSVFWRNPYYGPDGIPYSRSRLDGDETSGIRIAEGLRSQPLSIATLPTPRAVLPRRSPSKPPEPSLIERVRQLDWYQFEKLVAAIYRARGFQVTSRGGAHADGGVDLIVCKDGRTIIVQCKQWRKWKVKPDKVRELLGALSVEKAHGCAIITLQGFTNAARDLAVAQGVEAVDEGKLVSWLNEAKSTEFWTAIERSLDSTDKRCAKCDSAMVLRTARKGRTPGVTFWGCENYPRCDFILKT